MILNPERPRVRSNAPAPLRSGGVAGLHSLARLAAGAAFLVIAAGGMVTSTGSGLAVPDWPLSFGTLMPPMVGGIRFEHSHRLVAGAAALLTWLLAYAVLKSSNRPTLRLLASAAAGGILLQALLGGLTVLLKLPKPVSISHALLGPTVFCLLLCVMEETAPRSIFARGAGGMWKAGALAVAAVYAQLALGAVARHTGHLLALHVLWAFAAAGAALHAAYRAFLADIPALRGPTRLLLAAVPLQMALGLSALMIKRGFWPVPGIPGAALVTAHVAAGALILGTCCVWTLRAARAR